MTWKGEIMAKCDLLRKEFLFGIRKKLFSKELLCRKNSFVLYKKAIQTCSFFKYIVSLICITIKRQIQK